MVEQSGAKPSALMETTFQDLFDREILPSGNPFKLAEDTVDNALRMQEVGQAAPWRKKAIQTSIALESVGGIAIPETGGSDGVSDAEGFIHGMLDTDVIFASIAWTAQLNGTSIKLSDDGLPCPACAIPIREIPFGGIRISARPTPVGGRDATFKIDDLQPGDLPASLANGDLYVIDPTWKTARMNVSERSWGNPEVVGIYRALSSLRFGPEGKPLRALSMQGEAKKIRTSTVMKISREMDRSVPHFHNNIELECRGCKNTILVPFDLGV